MHTLKFLLLLAAVLPAAIPVTSLPTEDDTDTAMLQMLDSLQQLLTGEPKYDRNYYKQLRDCMATLDTDLTAAQDGAWQGVIDYWNTRGTPTDIWGNSDTIYMEQNATNADFLNMTVYEPCDSSSNVAYYHDVMEICNRKAHGSPFSMSEVYVNTIGKSFSDLAIGSTFMHLSHTILGGHQDTKSISVLIYVIHQGSLSGLPNLPSILTDLQSEHRTQTALEIADGVMEMYKSTPVDEWYAQIDEFDVPSYYLTFAGFFSTVLTIGFKPEFVDKVVPRLAEVFGVSDDYLTFIMDSYLPEIRNATADMDIGFIEKMHFLEDATSTIGKLIYAFLWQEEIMTDNPIFLNPIVNNLGWKLLPKVNEILNKINNFNYLEPDFQTGTNIYPGDEWCNPIIPHAKWHLESGVGLLDLTFLADEMYKLLSKSSK